MGSRALVWIRRDLRLQDHHALSAATQSADQVAVVFVFDPKILDVLEDRDDRRVVFLHRSLAELKRKLQARGSDLLVRIGDPVEEIPRLMEELGAEVLHVNGDIEPYALQRDQEVRRRVEAVGKAFKTYKDHVIFGPREVVTQSSEPYKVYSPYARAWRARLEPKHYAEFTVRDSVFWPLDDLAERTSLEFPTLESIGFRDNDLWLEAGEDAAHARLAAFLPKIGAYETARNQFAVEGTSGLSVHLRHGTLSIRACVREAIRAGEAGDKWLSELIWRDFYQMILAEFPHVVQGAFKREWDAIEWPGKEEHFLAWAEGRTGFPIVDAAMRCFNATGWMHNRLRMVVAMFLTKDLLVDWRRGEAYFARKLLDFDLAANNGGWQWSASTGVDAQPYFRVFNPVLQSQKFDPDAEFIARWCPELAGFAPSFRHWPHDASTFVQLEANCKLGEDYPHPIVEHKVQAALAVSLFKDLRSAAGAV